MLFFLSPACTPATRKPLTALKELNSTFPRFTDIASPLLLEFAAAEKSSKNQCPGASTMDDEVFLQQFSSPQVDVAGFVAGCLRRDEVPTTLKKLSQGFAQVDGSIKKEVSAHEDSLLDQTVHIGTLEQALATVRDGVARIESAADGVGEAVSGPLETLATGVVELERIQLTCDLLRRTLQYVSVEGRLQAHLAKGQLPQAARALMELEPLEEGSSGLGAVVAVAQLRERVEDARKQVRSQASTRLMDGLGQQAQQEVTSALLAFWALGGLREKIRTAVSICSNRARRAVDAGVGSAELEEPWGALEATQSELQDLCLSVWHLQHVLVRVQQPGGNGGSLWDGAGLEESLCGPFWAQLAAK